MLRNNRMVKGRGFDHYRDTGDPVFAARVYNSQYVDELIFLDIDASTESRLTNTDVIEMVSKECFMPLTIGGGIKSVDQIKRLLRAGADKVVINTAAAIDLAFIEDAARIFGSQCIVVGIDVKLAEDNYAVYTHSGRVRTNLDLDTYIRKIEEAGAGEIFINSIDRDGMMQGYDDILIQRVIQNTSLPVIACGGAGNFMHLVNTIKVTGINALAMASIYHFGDNNPVRARAYLKNHDIPIKQV